MADEEDGTNEEPNKDSNEEKKPKAKKKRPWLLIGIVSFLVLTLLAGSVVGALYFTGMFDKKEQQDVAKGEESKEGEDSEDDSEGDEDDEEDEEEGEDGEDGDKKKAAIYVKIESTFVVNFEGASKIRFLQITVELMTRDETLVESINMHMPVIRNNLTFLFSSRTFEDVNTVEGKQQLRASALAEVQKIMEEETGKAAVDALYFTSFVTQ